MNGQPIFGSGQISRDQQTGRVRRLRGTFALPAGDTPADSVKSFLFANADELGLAMQAKDLKLVQDMETPTGRVVRYQQTLDGIPIMGTEIQVRIDRSSRVQQVDLAHVSPAKVSKPAGDEKALTATAAAKVVRDSLGESTLRSKSGAPTKVYFPTDAGLRLAFDMLVLTQNPTRDMRFIVDAYTGEILMRMNLIKDVDGKGLVFDPNPVVTASDNSYRDPTATIPTCGFAGTAQATIDAQRVTRTLRDITLSGGTYKLEGDYVKIVDLNAPVAAPPAEADPNAFNYPSNNNSFEAVMVYYHVDTLQRYLQNLGITFANNRQIEADVHDESLPNYTGAWYSGGDLALHFGNSGACRPDRAEDADCMLHEYNHAIMDNITPGFAPVVWNPATSSWEEVPNAVTGRPEAGALGEGYGDIIACVYFAPDHAFQREVFEDWVFAPGGLRRVDGTKIYPTDLVGEVHDDGEIWSAALWNVYRTIGGDNPAAAIQSAARAEVLKTMVSSYPSLGTTPNMMDAAEAMMNTNADLPEYRLVHGIEMLNCFHDRGILQCAAGSDLKITDLWSQQSESPEIGWQQVEYGQDNWFYARVRNDGGTTARAAVVTFSFQCPYVTPVYPADWRDHIISAVALYDLVPGATATVKACFPKELIPAIPPGATHLHGCILAEVYNPADHVPAGCTNLGEGNGKLRQCNTDVVNAVAGDMLDYMLVISNYHIEHEQLVQLEVIRPELWEKAEVWFGHRDPRVIETLWQKAGKIETMAVEPVREIIGTGTEIRVLEPTRLMVGGMGDESGIVLSLARGSTFAVPRAGPAERLRRATFGAGLFQRKVELVKEMGQTQMKLLSGHVAGFPYVMQPRERTTLDVHFKVPADAKPGERLKFEVIQRNDKGDLIGGFDVLVNVVAK
jgi:hypothetical protein